MPETTVMTLNNSSQLFVSVLALSLYYIKLLPSPARWLLEYIKLVGFNLYLFFSEFKGANATVKSSVSFFIKYLITQNFGRENVGGLHTLWQRKAIGVLPALHTKSGRIKLLMKKTSADWSQPPNLTQSFLPPMYCAV